MTINLQLPDIKELRPRITVFGVGGGGGNAVNNMIRSGLAGCEFVVANTDAQALMSSKCERIVQLGVAVTEGLGAGSQPEIGRAAAEEAIDELNDHLSGSHMLFITAGMGGGTGTGAAPVIARIAREQGILTVGVVTKPFHFEGQRRLRIAEQGIRDLQAHVDTLIVIPNQNLFRVANEKTTFADAFSMADQVLYSGVACITDLMVKEGLINLDFADVRAVMREMGKAMMGTGEASGERRAQQAAEAAIANPLLDETSMKGARGLLISITGGKDLTLFEVDEAASRIREEIDADANIILGATFDESMEGVIRVSVVATGIESEAREDVTPAEQRMAELSQRLKTATQPQAGHGRAGGQQQRPAAAHPQRPVTTPQHPIHVATGHEHDIIGRDGLPQAPHVYDQGVSIAPMRGAGGQRPQIEQIEQAMAMENDHGMGYGHAENPRIPRVEDFPPQVQREMQVRAGQAPAHHEEDRGPLGLLKRLAQVGLGRQEKAEAQPRQQKAPQRAPAPEQRRQAPPPLQAVPGGQPQPAAYGAAPALRPAAPASEYAPQQWQPAARPAPADGLYRPRQGDLDPHGRPIPPAKSLEDGELEIPAFLRRQAN